MKITVVFVKPVHIGAIGLKNVEFVDSFSIFFFKNGQPFSKVCDWFKSTPIINNKNKSASIWFFNTVVNEAIENTNNIF